jgi:putative tryptophan/tyrosine transport system substrate-binding protein
MRRREFIVFLGVTAGWPSVLDAQPRERPLGVGVLQAQPETDENFHSWRMMFADRLRQLGWPEGENVRIDYRYGLGDAASMPAAAKELVALNPDVILAITAISAMALRQYTLSIPTVFVQVGDPVALGLVTNLARPAGNITGFTSFNYDIGGKWIEMLKDALPNLAWVGIFFEAGNPSSTEYTVGIEAAAAKMNLRLVPAPVRTVADIGSAFAGFADVSRGAIIALPVGTVIQHRKGVIALAAQYRVPGMYPYRFFAVDGGLMSYGSDIGDQYRGAAFYVDQILKGVKPADLPVQQPTKFNFVINLKTAKALGLTLRGALIARADEVIE